MDDRGLRSRKRHRSKRPYARRTKLAPAKAGVHVDIKALARRND